MSGQVLGAIVGLAVFVIGCVYQAGRLSARVERLEQWRNELREDLTQIQAALRRLEGYMRGREE